MAAIGVAATVACLAIAAEVKVYVPFTPVPYTLQTFFVLLAGAALGPRLGAIALSSYLALGAVGVPIFTGQWLGPTTGYLVGFVAAGWLIGTMTRRVERPTKLRLALAMALGDLLLLALGAAWLAFGSGRGVVPALRLGVLCFLPAEAVKIAAAADICHWLGARSRALFP